MIVLKVGGSLFDHPRLGAGLRAYLEEHAPARVLLVPGGGEVVEAIRELDSVHKLGEEVSHALAMQAMDVTAEFLARLVGDDRPRLSFRDLDLGPLPHSWEVTSDSIAARVAVTHGAERLVLLKSIDVPAGTPWEHAANRGWVDAHFPEAVAGAAFAVEVVNFRRVLESLGG